MVLFRSPAYFLNEWYQKQKWELTYWTDLASSIHHIVFLISLFSLFFFFLFFHQKQMQCETEDMCSTIRKILLFSATASKVNLIAILSANKSGSGLTGMGVDPSARISFRPEPFSSPPSLFRWFLRIQMANLADNAAHISKLVKLISQWHFYRRV